MAKRVSLREFQSHLAARLAGAGGRTAAGLLGFQAGSDFWLLSLADSGEIASLPVLTVVPLTRTWFVGMANIRGKLYSVTDFSAFLGREMTPQNASSRLLLIGARIPARTCQAKPVSESSRKPGLLRLIDQS